MDKNFLIRDNNILDPYFFVIDSICIIDVKLMIRARNIIRVSFFDQKMFTHKFKERVKTCKIRIFFDFFNESYKNNQRQPKRLQIPPR